MKKKVLIICSVLITFSVAAYNLKSWNNSTINPTNIVHCGSVVVEYNIEKPDTEQTNPDFFYKVDTRFINTITKECDYGKNGKSALFSSS